MCLSDIVRVINLLVVVLTVKTVVSRDAEKHQVFALDAAEAECPHYTA